MPNAPQKSSSDRSPPRAVTPPLAERLRPISLEEVCGQEKVSQQLGAWLDQGFLPSLILWGPPGCGKTSLGPLLAKKIGYPYHGVSAIYATSTDIKKISEAAQDNYALTKEPSVLFVDEIHRFNKAQQDVFLPVIEKGTIILIGATTENPSFNLNNALLSRCHVLTLTPLSEAALLTLADRALAHPSVALDLTEEAKGHVVSMASGDARHLMQLLESLCAHGLDGAPLTKDQVRARLSSRPANYDKKGDQHYNLISALHKAVRGSDVDAALYWLARMLVGGEDPRYICRRLVRMAMEDIGLASPQALTLALDCANAYERLGSPEGDIALGQCVIYLASSPKSNSADKALGKAMALAKTTAHHAPPPNILNAPTALMKSHGYGAGYVFDHDQESGVGRQPLWPQDVPPQPLYEPKAWGFESTIIQRIEDIKRRRG